MKCLSDHNADAPLSRFLIRLAKRTPSSLIIVALLLVPLGVNGFVDKRSSTTSATVSCSLSASSLDSDSSAVSPLQTIVVTGATGKVGSRLIQKLLTNDDESTRVIALVRNGEKARSMFATGETNSMEDDTSSGNYSSDNTTIKSSILRRLEIVEADFENTDCLRSTFHDIITSSSSVGLFLSCGNVPSQETIELNVARAASEAAKAVDTESTSDLQALFCVKLSTAQPVMEQGIGAGIVHTKIEEALRTIWKKEQVCILRPAFFVQMLDPEIGGKLMGVDLRNESSVAHPWADCAMAMVDCDDVASCAQTILRESLGSQKDATKRHGGQIYELTGSKPVSLSSDLAQLVTKLRGESPFTIHSCSIEEHCAAIGMPASSHERMSPFFNTLSAYNTATDTIEQITNQPPRSFEESILENTIAFLPSTFQRLVGKKSSSFREAAKVTSLNMQEEWKKVGEDEVLIRVQVAGVNGGADTFSVTKADDNVPEFALGNEGIGIVVKRGAKVDTFTVGQQVLFLGGGYTEYVRVAARRCLPTSESLAKSPPAELTALRISGLTAIVALTRTCPVQKGDVVLVSACCGGTGHFATQIAKNNGATVIGTVGSTAKLQTAQQLNACNRIVDLSREDLNGVLKEEFPQGVNVAYEGVGGKVLQAVCQNLAPGGRVLVVGSISQYPHNENLDPVGFLKGLKDGQDIMDVFRSGQTIEMDESGRMLIGNVWGDIFTNPQEMADYRNRLFDSYAKGEIQVLLDDASFRGVDSVCDAVDHMLSRKSVGKVHVTISD